MKSALWDAVCRVRDSGPLVHNITNFVVMNNTANALLAIGASPVMAHAVEEVEDLVGLSGALVINIGTLSVDWIAAMHLAAARAGQAGVPWVLDPVGVGATRYRNETAAELTRRNPSVIRGNASEVMALAGAAAVTKGVDSTASSSDSLGLAQRLASSTGGVVAVTGATDYITDGIRVHAVSNGHPMMARVTGLGCTASALVGAFLAVEKDALWATTFALAAFGVAGEIAAEKSAGPGSLQVAILDALHNLDRTTLESRARID